MASSTSSAASTAVEAINKVRTVPPDSVFVPELAYNLNRCIGDKECGLCIAECPESAIFTIDSDVKVRINRDLSTNCGKCVPVYPPKALYLFGRGLEGPECGT